MAQGQVRYFQCRLRARLTKRNKINAKTIGVAEFIYRLVKNLSNGKFYAEKHDSAAQFFAIEFALPIKWPKAARRMTLQLCGDFHQEVT